MAKCKICGAPHKACGPRTTVIPVDQRVQTREEQHMPLKRYTVQSGRRGDVTAVVKLTEEEAKRMGAKPVDQKQATSQNKARSAPDKARTARSTKADKPAEKPAAPAADK